MEKPKVYDTATEELAALQVSIAKAQLEDLELSKRERALSIKEKSGTIDKRENENLQRQMDRESSGRTFAQQKASDEGRQKVCTHKKGGVVSARNMSVLSTGGNSIQYAVIKHQMINGDMWVRCLRCGKTWLPPAKDNFVFNEKGKQVAPKDGKFDAAKFDAADIDYRRAVNFETNNSPSGSVQCRFTKWDEKSEQWVDATMDYRNHVKSSTLR